MYFIRARDALMHKHGLNRKLATLAIRIARKIDSYEIIVACIGFTGKPLLTYKEYTMLQELVK